MMTRRVPMLREIRLGIRTLILHKLRSLLTILGVVFGVGSVVAMLAVGEGASQEALRQIRQLGSHNLIIDSIKPTDEAVAGGGRVRMVMYGLRYLDEARIREGFPAVARLAPAKIIRKEVRLGATRMEMRVVGSTPDWFQLVRRPVVAGRVLTALDEEQGTAAAVLTEHGARRLLANANTLGQSILVDGKAFEVVGIIRSAGGEGAVQTPDQDVDIYIPMTTARRVFGDLTTRRTAAGHEREWVELHAMIVEARELADVEPLAWGIETMLRTSHPDGGYQIRVPLALLRQAEATRRNFNIVLGSIAGISLLVGGIGIMNIMLASVTERTREIGIRRAIGARRRQIVRQFLIETVVLSLTGGLIGVGLGLFIPLVITQVAGMPTVVTAWSLILSLGISVGVGIVFGLYPAARAARLDPIQALRHE